MPVPVIPVLIVAGKVVGTGLAGWCAAWGINKAVMKVKGETEADQIISTLESQDYVVFTKEQHVRALQTTKEEAAKEAAKEMEGLLLETEKETTMKVKGLFQQAGLIEPDPPVRDADETAAEEKPDKKEAAG